MTQWVRKPVFSRRVAAYVPLDPEYPAERLAFLLRDSAAPVLLTQERLLPSLPDCSARVLCLDADASTFADESEANPPPLATPDNLAYVIYTSGSTGVPKGVLVSHDNVVRLFRATQPWFEFDRHDVWTLFHSFAFDFSVWEIWGALLHGGRLVVVPFAVTRSPREFHQLLLDERVTVLNQTPSAFRPLIAADQARRGAGELCLRLVIFGGEALELAEPAAVVLEPRRPEASASQYVWHHRDDGPRHLPASAAGRPGRGSRQRDRPPDPRFAAVRAREQRAAGADRGPGRDLRRRGRRGPRLPEPPGADRSRGSSPTPSAASPRRGCIGPATWHGVCPMATSSTWVGSISR